MPMSAASLKLRQESIRLHEFFSNVSVELLSSSFESEVGCLVKAQKSYAAAARRFAQSSLDGLEYNTDDLASMELTHYHLAATEVLARNIFTTLTLANSTQHASLIAVVSARLALLYLYPPTLDAMREIVSAGAQEVAKQANMHRNALAIQAQFPALAISASQTCGESLVLAKRKLGDATSSAPAFVC
jgi:hypothetical protein